MPLAFDAAILSRMRSTPRPFPRAQPNPKENQDLDGFGGENTARENAEQNAKLHQNDPKRRAKCVQSVRGTFAGTGPPQIKAAPGALMISPDAAMAEHPFPKESEARDKSSPAAKQACRALVRADIGASLRLAIDNAALALRYFESGDDFAVQYLTQRSRAYAAFAAETALELRGQRHERRAQPTPGTATRLARRIQRRRALRTFARAGRNAAARTRRLPQGISQLAARSPQRLVLWLECRPHETRGRPPWPMKSKGSTNFSRPKT
jgi:hypothetical protein